MSDPRSLEALYQDLDTLSPTHRALFFQLLRKEGETLAQMGIPRRVAPDAPLSYSQERIWNAGHHAPAGGVDNVPLAIRLDGPLDVDVLRQSLAVIAERHEILRSSIQQDDGLPRLVVPDDWALPFEVVQPEDLDSDLRRRALAPFDLASDSLLHVTLFKRSATDHVLLIVLHQLVSDGLSLRLMLRELSALYGAGGVAGEAADRPADLPERRVEYADVATWQREWMSEADLAVQRAYWETQLAGVDKPTRIADADADERAAHPSAAVPVGFSPNLSAAVRRLATATGATPYMTILAGLYATLAAETGDEDLLVASLVSSRTLPETETLLGNFSNTLLLRQHLPANSTFSDTLRQVKADVLDAYRHQDYPFVEVQRFVNEQASRRADASPYQVLLIVRDSRLDRDIQLTGVQAEAHLVDLGQTRLPLSIDLVDDGASPIGGRVTYAADLFDASAVEAFVQRLVAVLERAVQDPGMSIDALGRAGDSPSVRSADSRASQTDASGTETEAADSTDRRERQPSVGETNDSYYVAGSLYSVRRLYDEKENGAVKSMTYINLSNDRGDDVDDIFKKCPDTPDTNFDSPISRGRSVIEKIPVVIFGASSISQTTAFHLKASDTYEVACLTVHDEYIEQQTICGLPVIGMSQVMNIFPPGNYVALSALGFSQVNDLRKRGYKELKTMGYTMISFVHRHAMVDHKVEIGENCIISAGVTIEPNVRLGNNVVIGPGVTIGHDTVIEDDCFIAAGSLLLGSTRIGRGAIIGAQSTIVDGCKIGSRSIIGAGSLIVSHTEKNSVYLSDPATLADVESGEFMQHMMLSSNRIADHLR